MKSVSTCLSYSYSNTHTRRNKNKNNIIIRSNPKNEKYNWFCVELLSASSTQKIQMKRGKKNFF